MPMLKICTLLVTSHNDILLPVRPLGLSLHKSTERLICKPVVPRSDVYKKATTKALDTEVLQISFCTYSPSLGQGWENKIKNIIHVNAEII